MEVKRPSREEIVAAVGAMGEDLPAVAKACLLLCNPTRIMIARVLQKMGSARTTDIAAALGFTPPAVTQHMTEMARQGAIYSDRDAQSKFYSIDLTTDIGNAVFDLASNMNAQY